MRDVPIPRYVDAQHQMFFWEIDEVVIIVGIIGVGVLLHALLYSLVPAYLISKLFSKYKNGHLDGILQHMAYWAGFLKLNKVFTNGQIRHYEP